MTRLFLALILLSPLAAHAQQEDSKRDAEIEQLKAEIAALKETLMEAVQKLDPETSKVDAARKLLGAAAAKLHTDVGKTLADKTAAYDAWKAFDVQRLAQYKAYVDKIAQELVAELAQVQLKRELSAKQLGPEHPQSLELKAMQQALEDRLNALNEQTTAEKLRGTMESERKKLEAAVAAQAKVVDLQAALRDKFGGQARELEEEVKKRVAVAAQYGKEARLKMEVMKKRCRTPSKRPNAIRMTSPKP